MTLNEYITAADAARMLGVTRAMITYYLRMRDLFGHRIGKTCLLRRADVEAFKEKRARR
jgi:excisionase family DNA binding protein